MCAVGGVHGEHSRANFCSAVAACTVRSANCMQVLERRVLFNVPRRNMRALGHLLVILGLAVAAFALRPGDTLDNAGASQADVGASRPIGASAAIPAAPISETVYVPIRRAAAPLTATATQESPRTPNLDLVRQLQHELTRVGCYAGDINGIWAPSTRRAMEALIERLNAKLPTARPEHVHLALVQGQQTRICDQCSAAEENQFGGRCANSATREVIASSIAPSMSPGPMAPDLRKPLSEQKPRRARRAPTEGRMGLGVSGQPPEIAQVGAKRSVADLGPRGRHRASHHAQRSQRYLRPTRPMRYAYRRPRGLFALLFGW